MSRIITLRKLTKWKNKKNLKNKITVWELCLCFPCNWYQTQSFQVTFQEIIRKWVIHKIKLYPKCQVPSFLLIVVVVVVFSVRSLNLTNTFEGTFHHFNNANSPVGSFSFSPSKQSKTAFRIWWMSGQTQCPVFQKLSDGDTATVIGQFFQECLMD